jgi:DNA-binding Lrp family transcriptional regulator
MAMAFVLINSEMGYEKEALAMLSEIPQVREAKTVYGVYDIVARVETEALQDLKDVVEVIRRSDLIRSTITMIVVELQENTR